MKEVQKAAEPRARVSSAEASRDLVFVANKVWLLTSLLNDRISAERSGWNCDALGVGGRSKVTSGKTGRMHHLLGSWVLLHPLSPS